MAEKVCKVWRYLQMSSSTPKAGLRCADRHARSPVKILTGPQGHGYKSAKECLHAQATLTSNASLLLCTWGESGASALELPSRRYVERPAYKTTGAKVVDTVGAGDTFIAGMLFGLTCHTTNWTLDRQLEFAIELAGRKVVQEGLRGLGNLVQHFF
ncbi:MAG: hypothetical protein Q9197_003892 [Variospora fuerteventurae]